MCAKEREIDGVKASPKGKVKGTKSQKKDKEKSKNKAATIDYPIDQTLAHVTKERCPILHALDVVGQKWKLPILWYLHEAEATRFNELKRRVPGITNMMLTKSLRELEEAGLVDRRSYDTVPPRVEYALTEMGQALLPTLNELYQWGEIHMNRQA